MTQEEKELLLVDLSARLPYGVIVSPIDCGNAKLIGLKDGYPILFDLVPQKEYDKPWEIEYIKPYLRKMSSMTEEEEDEFNKVVYDSIDIDNISPCVCVANWLYSKCFDVYGLIPKGLAIEVTEENNPYKTELS